MLVDPRAALDLFRIVEKVLSNQTAHGVRHEHDGREPGRERPAEHEEDRSTKVSVGSQCTAMIAVYKHTGASVRSQSIALIPAAPEHIGLYA